MSASDDALRVLRERIGKHPIQLWFCPVTGHGEGGPPRETVRWIGDVAHCMEPGCNRTSDSSTLSPREAQTNE
jgi:hypothetical protein